MRKAITEIALDGFTAHSVVEGESVRLVVKDLATSESSIFFVYAEQIANLILPKLGASKDVIDRYLMVLHPDNTADVILQELLTRAQVRVKRSLKAGYAAGG